MDLRKDRLLIIGFVGIGALLGALALGTMWPPPLHDVARAEGEVGPPAHDAAGAEASADDDHQASHTQSNHVSTHGHVHAEEDEHNHDAGEDDVGDERSHEHGDEEPGQQGDEDAHDHGDKGTDDHGDEPAHDHGDEDAHEDHLTMTDDEMARFDIVLESVAPGQARSMIDLPGEVALNGHRTAQIVARIPGMVDRLDVTLGDEVTAGQVVATLVSRELADAKADYLAAVQREELESARFAREEQLRSEQISSEQEFIEARHALSEARILTRSAKQKLVAMGLSEEQISGLPDEPDSHLTRFEIRAPFAGSIIAREVERGEVVAEDTPIFVVADLSTVWLDLHVPDRDARRVCTGQCVTLADPPEVRGLRGDVEYVHPIVDSQSRTVLIRVTLPNAEGTLRPGQFVTARVAAQQTAAPVVVSREAIQYLDDLPVVFVREGEAFVARSVTIRSGEGEFVAVTEGLRPGERVATRNSFLLKSEIEKQAAGDVGHGHAH